MPPIRLLAAACKVQTYFILQLLNRHIPVLRHFEKSRFVHPERLYEELLRLAGRTCDLYNSGPTRSRLSSLRSRCLGIRLLAGATRHSGFPFGSAGPPRNSVEIVERAANAFVSMIRDRNLFRNANLVLEVAARRPLTEIQSQFPQLFKIGPNTKMNEIVHAHLPGVNLVHLPTPPPQIRAITDHVYFLLDRQSPLWPEFSTASSIGMHFSGDWPQLELELWQCWRHAGESPAGDCLADSTGSWVAAAGWPPSLRFAATFSKGRERARALLPAH